jgi:hypothetical protein
MAGKKMRVRKYEIIYWHGPKTFAVYNAARGDMAAINALPVAQLITDEPTRCWVVEVRGQTVYMYRHSKHGVEDIAVPVSEIRYSDIEEAPEWVKSGIGTLRLANNADVVGEVGVRISADDFLLYEP